jgi:hypothetical protein
MAMYSATDGLIDDFHLAFGGALGGAGSFLQMICVPPWARITPGCLGLGAIARGEVEARVDLITAPARKQDHSVTRAARARRKSPGKASIIRSRRAAGG